MLKENVRFRFKSFDWKKDIEFLLKFAQTDSIQTFFKLEIVFFRFWSILKATTIDKLYAESVAYTFLRNISFCYLSFFLLFFVIVLKIMRCRFSILLRHQYHFFSHCVCSVHRKVKRNFQRIQTQNPQ